MVLLPSLEAENVAFVVFSRLADHLWIYALFLVPAETKTREEALAPLYEQAALRFADLHDTPARMLAKSVISAVVPLRSVRAFLAARVRCRTAEARALDRLSQADPGVPVRVLRDRLRAAFLSRGDSGGAGSVWAAGGAWDSTADTALAQWLEGEGSLVVDRLAKQSAISRALATLRDSLGDSAESAVSALERVAEGA